MKKNILIINTGGTISSIETSDGVKPKHGIVWKMIEKHCQFFHSEMPSFKLIELDPLLDSSNLGISNWNSLAMLVQQHYDKFDGFVILHGTDTMAYSASALSFMLEGLSKPVILTGSQIPFSALRTDATNNLVNSLQLAANKTLCEVCIYFNHKLLRGNRSTKKSSTKFLAFDTPNYPNLASIGTDVTWHKNLLLTKPKDNPPLTVHALNPFIIANARLMPGMPNELLKQLLKLELDGLILETYGSGNAPVEDDSFIALLKEAQKRKIPIINVSQCYQSSPHLSTYQAGKKLLELGVIAGHDLTFESAYSKLYYLLNKGCSYETLQVKMPLSLKGEVNS